MTVFVPFLRTSNTNITKTQSKLHMPMETQQPFLVEGQKEPEEEEEEVALLGRRSLRRAPATEASKSDSTYEQSGNGNGQLGSSLTTSNSNDSSEISGSFSERCYNMGSGDKPRLDSELPVEKKEVEEEEEVLEGGNATVGSGSVYFDNDQGSECIYQHSEEVRCNVIEPSNFDPNPGDADILTNNSDSPLKEIDNHNRKILENKGFSGFNLVLLEQSPDVKHDTQNIEATTTEDFDLIEEVDREETDFDIEKVLEKQNTHDLYCPSCNSCITRRVILRRRKRKVRHIRRKEKCDKPETISELEMDKNSTFANNDHQGHETNVISSNDSPTFASEEHNQDKDVDIFRCLSCFSFFIPTGNGFKLFKISKSKPENEDLQLQPNVSSASTSWFFSKFTSNNKKSKTEEGNATGVPSEVKKSNQHCSPAEDMHIKPPQGLENDVPQGSGVDISVSIVGEDIANAVVGPGNKSDEATDKTALDGATVFHEMADADKQYSSLSSLNAMDKHLENGHSVASLVGTGVSANGAAMDCEIVNTVKNWNSLSSLDALHTHNENSHSVASLVDSLGKPVEVTSLATKQDGKHSLSSSTCKSSAIEQFDQMIDRDLKVTVDIEEPVHDIQALSDAKIHKVGDAAVSATIGIAVLENTKRENGQATLGSVSKDLEAAVGVEESVCVSQASSTIHSHQAGMDVPVSPTIGIAVLEKVKIDNEQKSSIAAEKEITGNGLIVVVEAGQPEPAAPQRLEDTGIPVEVRSSSQTEASMQRSSQRVAGVGIDILKCIVYGGLIESITSLGVVSSAAGGGAATLNILALGLANLIGGLFILCHNLLDLKNEQSARTSNQTDEQLERYQELLGRRGNFSLHATIVILSYLIFGLLPPVIYGFSYRKSDNVDYKLAAVGCASLICIALLAAGKAHVQRQPRHYIKTVLYYVIIGIMASGVSYVAGDLIDKLLEKIGWTESSWDITLESKQVERSWSSY